MAKAEDARGSAGTAKTSAAAEPVAPSPETEAGETVAAVKLSDNYVRADKVVKDHMLAALGIGLIPIPALDLALFMGSSVYMVKRLCDVYGVPFKRNAARGALTSIGSALGSVGVATGVSLSLAKFIPGAGTAAALLTLPVANAAFVHATGKIFIAHFETGGSLLDFEPQSQTERLKELFSKGKEVASSMLKKKTDEPAAAA